MALTSCHGQLRLASSTRSVQTRAVLRSFAKPSNLVTRASTADSIERDVDSDAAVYKADWPMKWSMESYDDAREKGLQSASSPSMVVVNSHTADSIERDVDSDAAVWKADWPMKWALESYDDLSEKCAQKLMQETKLARDPNLSLEDVMTREVEFVTAKVSLQDIKSSMDRMPAMPVVDDEHRLVGVVSRDDVENKEGAYVGDIMSSPPVAVGPGSKVKDAALLMLKHKVQRIPVVDRQAKVVGLVTRSDVFS